MCVVDGNRTVRHALHQADVEADPAGAQPGVGGEQRRAARAARAARATPAAHSSHSMTVPVIWKNGNPALVCQDWGDLITRLLIVSRTERHTERA